VIEKLKLTEGQLKQMRQLSVDFQSRTRKARTALMGLHDEKRTMVISGKIDLAKLAKLDEEIVKLTSEVMSEDFKMEREQLSTLTPEQADRLAIISDKGAFAHEQKMTGR
jgi:Spy/CpxP family protein refolding chaperone